MEKCDKCGAALNPTTNNCDVCDGRGGKVEVATASVTPEPIEAEKPKKSSKKKR